MGNAELVSPEKISLEGEKSIHSRLVLLALDPWMVEVRVLFIQLLEEFKPNQFSSGSCKAGSLAVEGISNAVGASRGVLENKLEGLDSGNPPGMLSVNGG